MTINALLSITSKQLNSDLEAQILLSFALDIDRTKLATVSDKSLTPYKTDKFNALVQRRIKHEPIAYIVGFQPFYGLEIKVNHSVLIPRPETEEMVERTIRLFLGHGSLLIADIGTGSGAIAVALAKNLPKARIIGIDSSKEALIIAKENSKLNKVDSQCDFRLGNLLEPLNEQVDLIISNPPYIPTKDLATLDPDVKDYEPILALDSGPDGLDHIRELIKLSPKYSKRLILEFGFGQEKQVKQLAIEHYDKVEIIKDLSQKPRFLLASKG